MGKIVVLDDNMVNVIAAGEVIERPANVVKELLENSIDAGAKKIIVNIEDGGRKLISITDNGTGMDAEDLALAFQPHATSKIRSKNDLSNISTMGFRGEALASIGAVSRVTVTSRTPDSIEANRIDIDCGRKTDVKPTSADYGTTIETRDLFYKLPVRKKFLRTANTEMTHIQEHFARIALAHCDLDMTLIHNSREIYRLLAVQNHIQRIEQLLGKTVTEDLLSAQTEEKGIKISALLGKPSAARASNKYQYVFLNNRFIKDKFILHAVKEAYRGLIEPNRYPAAFLYLQMPPDAYDVNVHPTKIEVRFQNANLVHSQVLSVLRQRLLSADLDVGAALPNQPRATDFIPTEDAQRKERIEKAMADFFKNNSATAASQKRFGFSGPLQAAKPAGAKIPDFTQQPIQQFHPPNGSKKFLQLHNSYIVTQTDEGFNVIDQHALHERIIYEQLCRNISTGPLQSQRLLIPETIEITGTQNTAITDNFELFEKMGIEIVPFGPKTIAIQSFPTILDKASPAQFLQDMLDMLTDKSLGLDPERLLHEILDMAACKAAIKAGQPLSEQEMQQLLNDKDTIDRASRCPHGRPTTIKFSIKDLEKQFKRT